MSSVVKPKVTARSILVRTLLAALLPSRPLASYSIFAWWLLSFAFSFSTFQARRLLSQPLRFRFALTPLLASQARSIHISFAPWLLPKPRLFHFLLRAPTCRPAHSTTASFARLRPSQLCPFSSFFAPCLALLAHPSRDVFVRCFQRCRYGSSAYSEHLRKFISPRLLRPPTHPTSARPTVPYPFPEGRALDCAARRWRVKISGAGTFSCLGYFLLGLIWTSLGAGVAL